MTDGGESKHGERIAILETKMQGVEMDVLRHETEISGLKRFQAWLFGIGSGIGAVAGLFAQTLKDRFGIG